MVLQEFGGTAVLYYLYNGKIYHKGEKKYKKAAQPTRQSGAQHYISKTKGKQRKIKEKLPLLQ